MILWPIIYPDPLACTQNFYKPQMNILILSVYYVRRCEPIQAGCSVKVLNSPVNHTGSSSHSRPQSTRATRQAGGPRRRKRNSRPPRPPCCSYVVCCSTLKKKGFKLGSQVLRGHTPSGVSVISGYEPIRKCAASDITGECGCLTSLWYFEVSHWVLKRIEK